jgi:hypothetical protein
MLLAASSSMTGRANPHVRKRLQWRLIEQVCRRINGEVDGDKLLDQIGMALASSELRVSAPRVELTAVVEDEALRVSVAAPTWNRTIEIALHDALRSSESLLASLVLSEWNVLRVLCEIGCHSGGEAVFHYRPT